VQKLFKGETFCEFTVIYQNLETLTIFRRANTFFKLQILGNVVNHNSYYKSRNVPRTPHFEKRCLSERCLFLGKKTAFIQASLFKKGRPWYVTALVNSLLQYFIEISGFIPNFQRRTNPLNIII
jgi:hypothetical protein